MPYLELSGTTLHYLERGEGDPLLLLHAYPLTADTFAPQLEGLSDRWRVIAPDHRGFGGSGPLDGPLTMEGLAQDVLNLMDALELPQVVVGGCSMGGYVAMALLRADPSRIRGLVLMGTQPLADDDDAKAGRETSAKAAEEKGIDAVVEAMLPKLLSPAADEAVRHKVEALIRQNRVSTCAAAQRGMGARQDSREILARFHGPALVIRGDDDAAVSLERAQQLAELVHTQLVEIPGAGHLVHLERPEAVNAALRGFLETLG